MTHLRRLAQISRWMQHSALDPSAVDERVIERVVESLHGAGTTRRLTAGEFGLVLRFLRWRGVTLATTVAPPSPVDELLGDYRRYLLVERSLAPLTVTTYLASAAWFVVEACTQ